MKKSFLYLSLSVLLLLSGIGSNTLKANPGQPPVLQVLDGSQGQLSKDSFNIVSDTLFFNHTYDSALVRNTITFRINPYSLYSLQGAFTATARLELTVTAASGAVSTFDTSLTIRYNKDSAYTDQDSYIFSNAYRVKVKILDRSTDAGWDVWKTLELQNELQSFPVYTFDCSKDTVQSATHAALDSNTTADELPVSWTAATGADWYDLEWTYIDSSALAGPAHLYGNPASPSASLIFDNNCSRVTITGTSYNIPIFYDGAGTLFFRVRPVQLQAGGGRTEGHWTSDQQVPGSWYFKGHQRNLNWQSTASYAEEGKRKVVVQYYDGSLRGRQTVTKDNTTNTTLVSESYYDYQGRPVIQVLPAPTFSSVIKYSQNFNLGLNGAAYDKNDFDTLYDPTLYCNTGATAMSTDSGASQYYSPSNPDKDTGIHKYIPDAQGYPFTQVEYLQDNTGRISRQSGVGPTHKLGSGHETQYYYGTPDQRELDALFGTEVGDHSHYFKTMVRDANGQFSVSYTDMHGRTIATALAGAPDSVKLDTLASYRSQTITETLSDPASNVIKDLVMESKKGLLVAIPGIDTFTYKLNPASLQLADCNNTQVCYDCLYDLEITMTDDCNNQKLGGQAFDTVFHNFTLGGRPDTTCAKADSFTVKFTKYLPVGSYEITKRLSVSRYGENYYRDSVFMKRNACRNNNSFLQEQQAIQASITQCQPTCQSCNDSLGTWTQYYARFVAHAGIAAGDTSYDGMIRTAYQEAQAACNVLCNTSNEADDILKAMLLDMTPPSGQYANVSNLADAYSIFHVDTNSTGDPNDTAKFSLSANRYLDENGHPDSVYDEAAGKTVRPQDLTPDAFADKFKLTWAQALLPYHPEYCKLVQYQLIPLSPAWDKRFEAVDTYGEALSKGYLNPAQVPGTGYSRFNATDTADYDPLATHYTGYQTALQTAMTSYLVTQKYDHTAITLTVWEMATAAIRCAGKDSSCIYQYRSPDSAFNSNVCTGDLDMIWRNFRQSYLDIKRKVLNDQLKSTCGAPTATTLFKAGHQPHFTDAGELSQADSLVSSTDPTTVLQQNQASVGVFYDSTCRAYVTMWWQDLQRSCVTYSSADSAVIIPRLIGVCREGSDANHPYGASSTAPASTYAYTSFEDVITRYNDSIGNNTVTCNAYGITAPKPYDQQTIYSVKPLWTRPDSCECSQIASMYANYQAVAGHYTSFSDYLNKSFQATISDSVLTLLRSLCSSNPATATCNYLAVPIQLPPVLQCGAGDICVGSTEFKSLDSQFRARYPGLVPVANPSPTDSAQIAINQLYENFLNYRLGFSKATAEYLAFLSSVNGVVASPTGAISYDTATITCTGLDSLLNEYKHSYLQPVSGYANLDMRTFAGNITPAEGPKGVFDVNGLLIGNTIDGTQDQINASFAQIWNSSSVNNQIGTLSSQSDGKFHLQLNPGKLVPVSGITGMRYYQFETPYDTLDAVLTNLGSYIDFGDGQHIKVDSGHTSSTTSIGLHTAYIGYTAPGQFYWVSHIYPSTQSRTVTVYHTDINGILGFDNYLISSSARYLPGLKNLRGYAPQNIMTLLFHSTQDSSFNTLNGFINKAQLSGLIWALFASGDNGQNNFRKYNFGSLQQFNTLRSFRWNTDDTIPTDINSILPNIPVNFPLLQEIEFPGAAYSSSVNLSLAHLECVICRDVRSTWEVDSMLNQAAAFPTRDSGLVILTGVPRSAASNGAMSHLSSLKWSLYTQSDTLNPFNFTLPALSTAAVLSDAYPATSQFADFINSKFGSTMNWHQVNQFYLKKCGVLPDYSTPDSSVSTPLSSDSCGNFSFIRTFSGNRGDSIMDIVQTSDGGYLTTGSSHIIFNDALGFVAKTDRKGALQWYKTYSNLGTAVFRRIRNTRDGGFIVLGNTDDFSLVHGAPLLVKGASNGEVQWSRTLSAGSTDGENAIDVIQTSDGGYAIAANYNNIPDSVRWEVIRLDSMGGNLWAKEIANSNTKTSNSGGLLEDRDTLVFSGLAVGSSLTGSGSSDGQYDGVIIKINKTNGNIIWSKSYGIAGPCNWFFDIHNTANGYLVNGVSTINNDGGDGFGGDIHQVIVEVDKNGNLIRVRKIMPPIDYDAGSISVYPTLDGGYISTQGENDTTADVYIQKTNASGSIAWSNRIVLAGDQHITRVIQNSDGGYTAAGYTRGKSFLLRTDSLGRTGCSDSTVTFSNVPPTDTVHTVTLSVNPLTIINSSPGLTATSVAFTETTQCYNSSCPKVVTDTLFLCGRAEPVFTPVSLNTVTNCSDSNFFAVSKSTVLYGNYTDSLQGNFDSSYRTKCMQAYKYESFTVTHAQSEYHHTLYYYDQAGNLLKTVPPAGVQANYDSLWLDGVAAARAADGSLVPTHGLNTQYRYNTLNQVIAQQTPDAGQSHFWYDRLGRLAISQNARQKYHSTSETNKQYSYTLYDYIGRITEVGQIANATSIGMTDSISRNESYLTSWITNSVANKEQITQTVYDLSYGGFTGVSFNPIVQRNLRNRVSYTSYTQGSNPAQYNQGTFYTYDIEGNVDTLLQDYGNSTLPVSGLKNIMNMNGNRFKRMVYQYDLVSGKVNSVAYQPHQVDAFYHRYTYDAENRLILAETSQDSVYWDKEARYEYYKHGPLARIVIGDKMVQGIDYAYTLQGWLKGVNSSSLLPAYDMGRDGDTSHQNRYVGRDAYGFSLNYYAGDYNPISSNVAPFPGSSAFLNSAYRPLYNGNISSMGVNIGQLYRNDSSHWRGPMVYSYRYDQLNRITGMDAFYGLNQATNSWAGLQPTQDFKERIAYDGNGNIQKYLRNNFGETGLPMDSLGYKYLTGTNKLAQIRDSAADFVGGNYDLHSQPVNNYAYDSIGNLIKDSIEHIHGIQWNVYGKIIEIDHDSTTAAKPIKNIYYYYDAAGNRIGKKTTRRDSTAASYTWYVRDASGNVMATYTASVDTSQALSVADLHIGEKHIYGSSRLGILNANYSTDATTDGLGTYVSPWTGLNIPSYTGKKQYELTNHLGNVLATISDKKIGVSLAADSSLIDHYEADVQTAQDYYPFGMAMPGRMFTALTVPGGSVSGTTQVNGFTVPVDLALSSRSGNEPTQYVASRTIDLTEGFESADNDDVTAYLTDTSYAGSGNGGSGADGVAGAGKYRYGFNGKEKDDEVKGIGDQVDYGARIYDPRVGRFLSVDPLHTKGPEFTPYGLADNSPIAFIDVDGKEGDPGFTVKTTGGKINIKRPLLNNISREQLEGFIEERVNEISPPRPTLTWAEKSINGVRTLRKFANATQIAITILSYNTGDGPLYEKIGSALYSEYEAGIAYINGKKFTPTNNHFEIITSDPTNLPDWYMRDIKERLISGKALPSDWNYKEELVKRGVLPKIFGTPQELGKPASSDVLGRNLERAGSVRPVARRSYAAHHIVEGTDRRAANARQILQREGIDINDAANGVFLDASYHQSLHTDAYRDKVFERINGAAPGKVKDELRKIATELQNGKF
ncbi:MAG TPA: AHH domain-containing protein [Puia sp.]|nr:AHH domain-containing protein [Puia sp.]